MFKGAVLALALPLVAVAAEPVWLTADQVRGLVTGNTIEARGEQGGPYRVYFAPDGHRLALQPDAEQSLPWRVLDDGSHCVTTSTGDDCARVGRSEDGTYARYREGRMVTQWLRILPGKELGTLAPGLYVRQLDGNRYILDLIGPASLGEAQAHANARRAAESVCKAQMPLLGQYRFESTEKVGGERSGAGSLRFTQELSCVPGVAASAPAVRGPLLKSAQESLVVQQDIRRRTETYLRNIAEGRAEEAYAEVSAGSMGVDAATWKQGKLAFRAGAGDPVRLAVWRITVYDNPESAAEPGVYVAADFDNEYTRIAQQCGYVMWFRPVGAAGFSITREETGNINAGDSKSIPAADLKAIRQRFHCAAP